MLRDRLVCGCRDRRLQFKLLSDPKLTLKTALEATKADETAERGTKIYPEAPLCTSCMANHRGALERPSTSRPRKPLLPVRPLKLALAVAAPTLLQPVSTRILPATTARRRDIWPQFAGKRPVTRRGRQDARVHPRPPNSKRTPLALRMQRPTRCSTLLRPELSQLR